MKQVDQNEGNNLLIQETSSSVISTSLDWMSEGIPGELHPLTIPITMNDKEAAQAAAICKDRNRRMPSTVDRHYSTETQVFGVKVSVVSDP